MVEPQRCRAEGYECLLRDMPEVRVVDHGFVKKKPREVISISGLPSAGVTWTHANNVGNVVESVHERVLGRTVDGQWERTLLPEKGAFAEEDLLVFRKAVVAAMGGYTLPITTEQFVDHYGGLKRARYVAAAESLERKPLQRSDSYPSVFLKAEKWHEAKAGRLISARSPRYNLAVGRYLLPIESRVYKAVDEVFGAPTIMKGLTPVQRAEVVRGHWDAFDDPVAVGQDFSKFDQHISQAALSFEHGFYLAQYHNDPELQRLLSWQLSTKCFANVEDGVVSYTVRGGRMSGDMNTAMGNCIISASLIRGYTSEIGVPVRAIVDGDDSVVFMERRHLKLYLQGVVPYMKRHGFHLTVEAPAYTINMVEFCQCRYMGLDPPTMVRNPAKAITQDHCWVVNRQLTWHEVMAATGLGGLALYGNVPVLGAYYDMLSRAHPLTARTRKLLETRDGWLRDATFSGKRYEPCERARYEFWLTWGIPPQEQRDLEASFDALDMSRPLDSFTRYNNKIVFPTTFQYRT